MSDEPIVALSLTQKDIDALYIISALVAGGMDGMRGVFDSLYSNLSGFVGDDLRYSYSSKRCNGSIRFKDGY